MALETTDIRIIVGLLRPSPKPLKVFSFGHPDILATPEELKDLFGKVLEIDNKRTRNERIGRSNENCIGSAFIVFEELGAELIALDKRDLFGIERDFDFNYPISEDHYGKYSLVIDPGTLEHVFNVGEGMRSVVKALKVGGYVYHVSPLSMFNHGYWNFCPVGYKDFYEANGFNIISISGRRKNGVKFEVSTEKKFFKDVFNNSMVVCVAQKMKEMEKIIWPMQGKYIK